MDSSRAESDRHARAEIPSWVVWDSASFSEDLDGDGHPEDLVLEDGRLNIGPGSGTQMLHTPTEWRVSDVFTHDLNEDDLPELVLITWKQGSFGSSKPFWLDKDSTDYSQHVFVLQYENQELKQLWMSSDIGFQARQARMDAEGKLHLVDAAGKESTWYWDEWGFTLEEDSHL